MFRRIIDSIRKMFHRLYSLYKRLYFKRCGKKLFIKHPCYVFGGSMIIIGDNFRAEKRLRLEAFRHDGNRDPKIFIGDNVCITWGCHIGAINRVEIGDNVLIGSRVLITDHAHGHIPPLSADVAPACRELYSKGAVKICKNVWIGEGAAILPGVTVGENTIIGANAVVTHSLPANCVAAGNPAKIIKTF